MRKKERAVSLEKATVPSSLAMPCLGFVVAGGSAAAPVIDFPGNAHGPVAARPAMALDTAAWERAVLTQQPALLVFEGGDPRKPLLVALMPVPPSPLVDLLVRPDAPAAENAQLAPEEPVTAVVDGERVVIEGKEEIVLKCGDASLTLRRDGRVVLRGRYVETSAEGTNRIRGGAVKIN